MRLFSVAVSFTSPLVLFLLSLLLNKILVLRQFHSSAPATQLIRKYLNYSAGERYFSAC